MAGQIRPALPTFGQMARKCTNRCLTPNTPVPTVPTGTGRSIGGVLGAGQGSPAQQPQGSQVPGVAQLGVTQGAQRSLPASLPSTGAGYRLERRWERPLVVAALITFAVGLLTGAADLLLRRKATR